MYKKQFFTLLIAILAFSLFLTACTGAATPAAAAEPVQAAEASVNSVTAEGKLLPAQTVELAFVQPGVVGEVLVAPGQHVAAGETLARLTGSEIVAAELQAARLEEILAQQALDNLRKNALLSAAQAQQAWQAAQAAYQKEVNSWRLSDQGDFTPLELALDNYVQAEQDYRSAYDELQRLKDQDARDAKIDQAQDDFDLEQTRLAEVYTALLEAIPTGDVPLDANHSQLMHSIAALELAREQAADLQFGLDPDLLAAAEARLETAAAHIAAAEAALANYELRAPFAGTVFSLDIFAGDSIMPGLPVIFVADTARWVVETTDLAEIYAPSISLGQSVIVKLDAFPDEKFTGKVSALDPVGREYLGDITYKITVTLDENDPRFLWNMTATLTIAISE